MSDPATSTRGDDQPLSDGQLDQIAGGGKPGMMSVNYPCDVCGELFTSYDALTRHTSQRHPA